MADKAYITPEVLKWARESAGIKPEEAAKKISVPVEKLLDWENGDALPTIRQAESLAKAYKRSFALFFLPGVPKDFQPLQDFRRAAAPLTTASIFIIRDIQQKQAWMREALEEAGENKLPFVGRFTIHSDSAKVAKDILTTLEINPAAYDAYSPIRTWIDKAELNGIFISRTSFIHSRLKLNSDELQGFTIADEYAPFIFVNTDDWPAPQLFTLVHEIAHIWIAQSGVSNHVESNIAPKDKTHPVEVFCNEVAANALMPAEIMQAIGNVFTSNKNVFNAAKKLGVSSLAFLVRALRLNIISFADYENLKKVADEEFEAYKLKEQEVKDKQKGKDGGPNPYLLRINKNSRLFTQIVIDGFRGGTIAPNQASSLLNTQVNKISKLEAVLYK